MILIIQGRAAGRDDDYQQEAELIYASRERLVCIVKSSGLTVAIQPKDIAGVKLSGQATLRVYNPAVEYNPAIDAKPYPL